MKRLRFLQAHTVIPQFFLATVALTIAFTVALTMKQTLPLAIPAGLCIRFFACHMHRINKSFLRLPLDLPALVTSFITGALSHHVGHPLLERDRLRVPVL